MAFLPALAIGIGAASSIAGIGVSIAQLTKDPPKVPDAPPAAAVLPTILSQNRSGADERRRQAAKKGRQSTILTGASELLSTQDDTDTLGG